MIFLSSTTRIASLTILVAGLGLTVPGAALGQETPAAPSVIVTEAGRQDITPSFQYVGRVEAFESVDLMARVDGFLEQRNFREGGDVQKGDLLFVIEQAPYEIEVEQRKADLAGARATLQNAEEDFKRKEALVERGTVARSSLDEARATLGTSRASVQQAQAALRRAELDLTYTAVTSPIDGKISRAAFSVGSLVGPGTGALATVTSIDPVYVTIAVTEKDLIQARRRGIDLDNPGVAPSLRLADGSNYEHGGEFDYLAPSVDQTTDTVVARAVFPNPERLLLPGQFVTVLVRQTQAVSAVVIPQASVQEDHDGYFVLVVDQANKVTIRRVVLGEQQGTDWIVEDGLTDGERVVVQGLQKIRPDMVVNPVSDQS